MKLLLKLISFLLGCYIIVILAVASNSQWLDANARYIPSPYRYGDLYMLSSMPGYRINTQTKINSPVAVQYPNTSLTVIGDSYTDKFDSSFFNSEVYHFIHWNNIPDTIPAPDSTKRNIVMIECAERTVKWRLMKNNLLAIGKEVQRIPDEPVVELKAETNLQYMLTHLDLALPFKELKASIYLNYFDKFNETVARPDGSGRLYLNETVDPKCSYSSFYPVEEAEIKNLVDNLNKVSAELSALGFDEVYFSIIPNPASIYKTSTLPYNQIIKRLQQHPETKFKFIDVLEPYKQEKNSVYLCNDSHWNALGKMMWLIKVNDLLREK